MSAQNAIGPLERPVGGLFVVSASFEDVGLSLAELESHCGDSRGCRALRYPDGSLAVHRTGDRWWDFGKVYSTFCQEVQEADSRDLQGHFSYESRIRFPAHTALPHEVAQVRVSGYEIAKRRDRLAIGFLTKRWPETNAIESPLEALTISIRWDSAITESEQELLLVKASEFHCASGAKGNWRPVGRIKSVELFRRVAKFHCDFSSASLHDFAWFVVHFATLNVVQRCLCFSILETTENEKSRMVPII